ncbi:hypothetical protein Pyn_24109 [Prunus yedoensis var. nudiflora]|uniref:Uncharacterized protein n=1 Tax=Prunus yedoensis var. nudiflora TaxID=2094558 RepID=A0A314YBJ8_PRUYE|nr:hypothetical protein Pyn_24109 [Prunus yedoensis var. nudiflora]
MPDYFVRTLLTIMHAILPPKPKPEKDSKKESASDGRKTKFKALAVADNKDRVKDIEKEIEMGTKEKRNRREEQDEEREEDRRRGSDRYREGDRDRDRDSLLQLYKSFNYAMFRTYKSYIKHKCSKYTSTVSSSSFTSCKINIPGTIKPETPQQCILVANLSCLPGLAWRKPGSRLGWQR